MLYEQEISLVRLSDGDSGRSSFVHIKYSNDGKTFTANNGEDIGSWLGIYTDDKEEESTVFSDYKWSKILGATGAVGTGIDSVTKEFYLSDSKTTQSGGTWQAKMPEWSYGKYLWTREKIVYKNPTSTVYTTPSCDSSWEAANVVDKKVTTLQTDFKVEQGKIESLIKETSTIKETYTTKDEFNSLQIGGRNLVQRSFFTVPQNDGTNGYQKNFYGNDVILTENVAKIFKPSTTYTVSYKYRQDKVTSDINVKDSDRTLTGAMTIYSNAHSYTKYFFNNRNGFEMKAGESTSFKYTFTTPALSATEDKWTICFYGRRGLKSDGSAIVDLCTFYDIKIEEGNVATAWTPAPEDIEQKVTTLTDKYNQTVQTVEGNKTTISKVKTSVDDVTGKVTTMDSRVTKVESTADGLKTTVSKASTNAETALSTANQTASKFNWIVKSGTSATDFTLTDRTAQLVADSVNLKGLVTFKGLDSSTQNKINNASESIENFQKASNLNNLIINGYGELGSNKNFSQWTYMGNSGQLNDVVTFGRTGDYGNLAIIGDAFIPVNTLNEYTFSMNIKPDKDQTSYYLGLAEYDIDKNRINAMYQLTTNYTYTTLAKDLKDGDTIVYLNDASSFVVYSNTPRYMLGLIFWNYKDSKGHLYDPGVYSRNSWGNLYDYTGVDKTANTIKLKSAWNHGTIASGTKVSQSNDGEYKYFSLIDTKINADKWTHIEWKIKGQAPQFSAYPPEKFNQATKYIRFVLLPNYNGNEGRCTYLNSVSLRDTTQTSDLTSKINTAKQEAINSASSDATNKINSAKNELNTKIDGIQIGGRNLMLSTQFVKPQFGLHGAPEVPVKDTDGFYYVSLRNTWANYIYQDVDLELGQTYTISCYAKCDSSARLEIKDNSTNNVVLAYATIDSKDWKLYSTTFVVRAKNVTPKVTFLTRQDLATIFIKKIKLELGNKNTDWSPAPEDLDSKISTSINDIKIGGRNLFGFNKGVSTNILSLGTPKLITQENNGLTIEVKYLQGGNTVNRISNLGFDGIEGMYTISGYLHSNKAKGSIIVDICDSGETEFQLSETPLRIVVSAYVNKHHTKDNYNGFVDIDSQGVELGQIIYIDNLKVERGNKATDWTPAPEDKAEQSIIDNWAKDSIVNGETVINGGYIKTNTIKTDQLAVDDIFATGSAVMYRINSQEINANRITSGLLSAERINAYGLSVINKITGQQTFNITNDGAVDIKGTVKSSNYNAGKTGWAINDDGTAEFNDIVARGSVITNDGGIVSSGGSGRNLLPNSQFLNSFTIENSSACTWQNNVLKRLDTGNDASRYGIYYNCANIKQNTSYVFSLDVQDLSSNGALQFSIGSLSGGSVWDYYGMIGVSQNKRITMTFTTKSNETKIRFYLASNSKGTSARLLNAKLEEGSIATPWSPAPEDKLKQVRFWAGSSYEKREEAPFIVYSDGSLKATQGEYSGLWTGDIQVGNISISDKKANAGNDALLTIQNGENGIKKVQLTDGVSSSFAQDVIVTNNTYSTMISLKQDGSAYLSKGLNVADKIALNSSGLIINNNTLTTTSSGGGFLFNNDLHIGSSNKSANLLIHGNASTDNITIDNTLYFGNLLKFTKNANGINIDFI